MFAFIGFIITLIVSICVRVLYTLFAHAFLILYICVAAFLLYQCVLVTDSGTQTVRAHYSSVNYSTNSYTK